MRFADVTRMKESTLKRFLRLERFEEHLDLHRMDCMSSHRDLTLYEFTREKFATMPAEAMRPAPLVNGRDLIEMGYAPGPLFKEVLSAVEDAQLEGALTSREAALQFVSKTFPRPAS